MKFVVRRAVAGLIAMPVVAGAYVLAVAVLVGAGAGATATVSEAWSNGLVFGFAGAVVFAFYPQLMKAVNNA